ncbi:MAG: ABC transporter permease [Desulfitobacteriia bacterium]|jgi:ABC-2 type transport system permease protein
MALFRAALSNELEKLYKKKKVLLALILSVLVVIIGQLIILVLRSGFGLRGVGSLEFSILILSIVVNTILPLFTALMAIDCFSGEYANNSIRITLTRPVSRFKIFTAKVTAIGIFILSNLLLLFILSTIAGFIFNTSSATISTFGHTFLAYLVSVFPLLVLALAIVLLTNILKSGTLVFFISIILFLALKAGGVLFSQYSNLFITSYLDWYNLWLISSLPFVKIIRLALLMLGYAIMLFTAGFYLFDKKEL